MKLPLKCKGVIPMVKFIIYTILFCLYLWRFKNFLLKKLNLRKQNNWIIEYISRLLFILN